MTKVIAAAIVIAVLFGIFELWAWYDRVEHEKEDEVAKAKAELVTGDTLGGLPGDLYLQFEDARKKGAEGLKKFLDTYGSRLDDPRKAWIQMDYCVAISRENPAEARRIFAEVKARTPKTSRIWKRIEELSKSFE
jgi:hypothetical protein